MICYIYRSPKKDEMYLYLADKNGFEELDDELKKVFGNPQFAMMVDLSKRNKLARADINRVRTELSDKGYYLQLPPKPIKAGQTIDD